MGLSSMKRYFPGRRELTLFAVLAVLCGAIAANVNTHAQDTALSLMVFPLFVFCAVLGLYKSGRLRRID